MFSMLCVQPFPLQEKGGWCSKRVREGYEMGMWKGIRSRQEDFKSRMIFRVGNEKKVKFWMDK